MSCFIDNVNSGGPMQAFLDISDERLRWPQDQWAVWDRTSQVRPWEDAVLWPQSRMGAGDVTQSLYLFGQDCSQRGKFEYLIDESGGQQQKRFAGVTRDSSSAPLGSCIVRSFLTASNLFVSQCTSDAGGYYENMSPYLAQNHYLVSYKAGSPDVEGSTVNTLQPA